MERIADLIMRDTALAAKILSLVNSPFFALSSRVQSVLHAITLLGQDIIRALVLSSKIFMTHEGMGLPNASLQRLGDHSYRVTTIAKHLARLCGKDRDETIRCSVAAMLHDVGKLVLATSFPDQFRRVVAMCEDNRMYIHDAEREVFGTTHAELGAYLLALWGMDADVVRSRGPAPSPRGIRPQRDHAAARGQRHGPQLRAPARRTRIARPAPRPRDHFGTQGPADGLVRPGQGKLGGNGNPGSLQSGKVCSK